MLYCKSSRHQVSVDAKKAFDRVEVPFPCPKILKASYKTPWLGIWINRWIIFMYMGNIYLQLARNWRCCLWALWFALSIEPFAKTNWEMLNIKGMQIGQHDNIRLYEGDIVYFKKSKRVNELCVKLYWKIAEFHATT